ncbi:MAG: hypothetical protein ACXWRZ_03060 [Bdellovibrio sp.]
MRTEECDFQIARDVLTEGSFLRSYLESAIENVNPAIKAKTERADEGTISWSVLFLAIFFRYIPSHEASMNKNIKATKSFHNGI